MQYFAPQLLPDQHSASLRATQYRRKPKSRHHHDHDRHDNHSSSSDDSDLDNASSNALSHPSFASPDLDQLRVAGLASEEEEDHHHHHLPPSPFPHAPARTSKSYLATAKIQTAIAAPPSRLFAVNTTTWPRDHASHPEPTNLRRTHLNVLSTVMHKCLLQGDYDRAGRAWGMILRTQATHGHTVDLRNHGRWAIGAEILLRRNQNPSDSPADDIFTEHGFELAREYYDRLIVQYPARRQTPHAVDQRTFYPAMFSLWVQQVCEKSKRARRERHSARRSRSRSMSIDSVDGPSTDDAPSRQDAVQVEELARAMEIAERLDDLVKSPPFDKQASLLQIRANVALWISDLIVGNTSAAALDEWHVYPLSSDVPAADQMAKLTNCRRELLVAQSYLQRVEDTGGPRQYQPLTKIETRLKELQRQMTRLEDGEGGIDVSMEEGWT